MKIGVLLGCDSGGDDLVHHAWVPYVQGHEMHVVSRIDPEVHLSQGVAQWRLYWWQPVERVRAAVADIRGACASFHVLFQDPVFQRPVSPQEVQETEAWLGEPLYYIASLNHLFKKGDPHQDIRDKEALLVLFTRLVVAFRNWFASSGVEVLLLSYEANALHKVARRVAKRSGVHVVGLVASRLPRSGIMLMEDFRMPVVWRPPLALDTVRDWYHGGRVTYPRAPAPRRPPLHVRLAQGTRHRRHQQEVAAVHPAEALVTPPFRLRRALAARAVQVWRRRHAIRRTSGPVQQRHVLFPLHYFRDAQISVREPFVDQWELIRAMARALPLDTLLLVRPHPHYLGSDLQPSHLRRILDDPRIRLLDPDIPPQEALRDAWCVATINSTLGFEALVHDVPLVAFGHDFYCRDEVAEVVRDLNDLPGAFGRAVERHASRRMAARLFVRQAAAALVPLKSNGYMPMDDEDARTMAAAVSTAVAEVTAEGRR